MFVSVRQEGNTGHVCMCVRVCAMGPVVAADATGCRASSPSSLTTARFLSRLAISILSGRQAGYFNALNCDSSHRSARMGARVTQRGIVWCFISRYHEERGIVLTPVCALYRGEKWAGFRRNIGLFISAALRL